MVTCLIHSGRAVSVRGIDYYQICFSFSETKYLMIPRAMICILCWFLCFPVILVCVLACSWQPKVFKDSLSQGGRVLGRCDRPVHGCQRQETMCHWAKWTGTLDTLISMSLQGHVVPHFGLAPFSCFCHCATCPAGSNTVTRALA